jgi:hypothetical protein
MSSQCHTFYISLCPTLLQTYHDTLFATQFYSFHNS